MTQNQVPSNGRSHQEAEQKQYQFEIQVANSSGTFEESKSVTVCVVQPNRTPSLTGLNPETTYAGETWIYQVLASDPDPGQKLTYVFSGDAPEGAILDPDSGLLIWQVPDTFNPGEVKFAFQVRDSGSPRERSKRRVGSEGNGRRRSFYLSDRDD